VDVLEVGVERLATRLQEELKLCARLFPGHGNAMLTQSRRGGDYALVTIR
jgi:hypothetical protein